MNKANIQSFKCPLTLSAMPPRQEVNHPVYSQIQKPKNGYIKLMSSKLEYITRFHIPIATVPSVPIQLVHKHTQLSQLCS